jgi:hypothetical protein
MSMTAMVPSGTLDLLRRTFHKPGVVCRAQSLPIVRVAAALSVALALAGCAAMQQTVGGWFRKATPTPTPTPQVTPAAAMTPRVYYAGVDGLKVYSEPSASSKVLGALSLHEKVTRTKLERGYAYVESAKSGRKGWVNNSQLIWRLPTVQMTGTPGPVEAQPEEPAAPTGEEPQEPAAPAEAPQEPEVVEPTATATESLPAPTPPKSQATPGGVAPSIFNPY